MVRIQIKRKHIKCGTARLPRAVKLKIAKAVEKDLLQGEGQNNNAPDGSCESGRGDFACYMDSNKTPQKKYSISLKERETRMTDAGQKRLEAVKSEIKNSDNCEWIDTANEYLEELEQDNLLENKANERHFVREFFEEVSSRIN